MIEPGTDRIIALMADNQAFRNRAVLDRPHKTMDQPSLTEITNPAIAFLTYSTLPFQTSIRAQLKQREDVVDRVWSGHERSITLLWGKGNTGSWNSPAMSRVHVDGIEGPPHTHDSPQCPTLRLTSLNQAPNRTQTPIPIL